MAVEKLDSTKRFTDRVSDYERYRPSYPDALLDYLEKRIGLKGSRVADIGAGTGIFSELLLNRGALVDVVEPNQEMLQSAVKAFGNRAGFNSRLGTAENTGLQSASVDLITCAQAFHWFEPVKTRNEFDRILKASGMIALIWNDQKRETGLGQTYEEIKVKFGDKSFEAVKQVTDSLDTGIPAFFGKMKYDFKLFDNFQELDEAGLIGRFFSSSYAPEKGTELQQQAIVALQLAFEKFQRNGIVRLEYKTELFLGY